MSTLQAVKRKIMPGRGTMSFNRRILFNGISAALLFSLMACAPMTTPQPEATLETGTESITGAPKEIEIYETDGGGLPVRFQRPAYLVEDMGEAGALGPDEDVVIQVGADISSTTGPVQLRDILKRLAALKNMNVSWANDVDQYVMTDVDIRSSDDFFGAIDNLLRQVDYFHEVQANTIVVKYKDTRKFHIAMPPRLETIASSTNTGESASTALSPTAQVNRWESVRTNLDQILEIWSESTPAAPAAAVDQVETEEVAAAAPVTSSRASGKGYYTINETIGFITVTAPQSLLVKIAEYINDLKSELYRQIAIEAKIVEVTLDNSSTTGLDWSDLFEDRSIEFELFEGTGSAHEPRIGKFVGNINIGPSFTVILNAIADQGETKVLSNPKVSVMNGQPAVIYVGDNVTYIDSVSTTITETTTTTSVTTAQATSGIRMEVFPTIIDDEEIILSLTPMISGLNKEIEYRTFGLGLVTVGLPEIRERTMNSIVRIKNGEILVVGGLIDKTEGDQERKVQFLGDLPVINKLFKKNTKTELTKEIVILLRPTIL